MRNKIGRPSTRGRQWTLAAAVVATVGGPIAGGALTAELQVVAPPSAPAFETASVTPGQASPPGLDPHLALEASLVKRQAFLGPDGRFTTSGPLQVLIQAAYNVLRFQVEGGPSWVRSDRFAIEAQVAGRATLDQLRLMLQSLLADRFKLTLRRETRTQPIYELVVTDGGLKIAAMNKAGCIPQAEVRWDLIDLDAPLYVCDGFRRRMLSQSPDTLPLLRRPRITRIEAGGVSMAALIDLISVDLDRVVLDRTGFTSPFNFVLDFAPTSDPAASGPTIFDAMQDQLGLQLRSTSGPIEILVIDRVERPSQN